MIILFWNIRSLISNRDTLMNIIRDHSPDVIGLNETWLKESIQFNIGGYCVVRGDRDDGKGGIALLIKNSIAFNIINLSNINLPIKFQNLIIELNNCFISLIYNPPDVSVPKNYFTHLTASVGCKNLLIMGDFNAQNKIWGSGINNRNGFLVADILEDHGLYFLNNGEATRITPPNQNKSVPDLIFGTSRFLRTFSFNIMHNYIGMSDHFPVLCTSLSNNEPEFITRTKFNTKKANWVKYYDNLITTHSDIELRSYELIEKNIIDAANKAIPLFKKGKCRGNSWWDNDCENARRMKCEAFRNFKKNFNQENYIIFRKLRAKFRKILREKRKVHFSKFCSSLNPLTPINEVWCKVKRFAKSLSSISVRKPLNSSIAQETFDLLTAPVVPVDLPQLNFHKLKSEPITFQEFMTSLERKSRESSPGTDQITYHMLRNLPLNYQSSILHIFNRVLDQSIAVPEQWKTSLICLIPKPHKDPEFVSSFRPIALSSCVGKILEDIVKNRLEWLLENKGIISDYQFGFRRGKGVADALAILSANILTAMSEDNKIVIVCLDMKGAYDNVNIDLLVSKLANLGLERDLCCYIRDISYNRKIFVIDHNNSKLLGSGFVGKGVAQGSPLAPTLFNIYVNDIKDHIHKEVKLIQYADDIALVVQGKSLDNMVESLNDTLRSLEDWSYLHGIAFQPQKSSCLLIQRRNKMVQLPVIKLQDEIINWVEKIRYLGIILDKRCSWIPQVEAMCVKANKAINIMKFFCKTWWGGHPLTMLNFYKAYVRSHLDYGSLILLKCTKNTLAKLDRVQFQGLRVCLGLMRSSPTNIILSEAAECPLDIRRNFLATKFLLKSFSSHENPVINEVSRAYGAYNQTYHFWSKYHTPPLIEAIDQIFPLVQEIDVENTHRFYENDLFFSKKKFVKLKLEKHVNNKTKFNEIISQHYGNKIKIYTDASKEVNKGVGIGLFSADLKMQSTFMISNHASIYTGEMLAIMKALEVIESTNSHNSVIFSDSQSALTALNSRPSFKDTHITFLVKQKLMNLERLDFSISLVWLPSHTCIYGNDRADSLANIGRTNGQSIYSVQMLAQRFHPGVERKILECMEG